MIRRNSTVEELATLMKNRVVSSQPPFLLVLGSNYFGSFTEILKRVTNTDNINLPAFFSKIQLWSPEDRAALLKRYFDKRNATIVSQNIVTLIQAGFFDTVITTSCDNTLEDTLVSKGFNSDNLRVHIIGVEAEERLRLAFSNSRNQIRIFKLYGSIQYPDSIKMVPGEQLKLLDRYRDELRSILARDFVLYGYLEGYDQSGIAQFLTSQNETSAWIIQHDDKDDLGETLLKYNLENRLTSYVPNSEDFFGKVVNILVDIQPSINGNLSEMNLFTETKTNTLKIQLSEARANLLLIDERESEYVIPTDIPLQLVKAKRHWKVRISELEQELLKSGLSLEIIPTANLNTINNKLDQLLIGQEKILNSQEIVFSQLTAAQVQSVNIILQRMQEVHTDKIETDETYKNLLEDIKQSIDRIEQQPNNNFSSELQQLLQDSKDLLAAGVDIQTGLELTIPLIPLFLNYKLNLDTDLGLDIQKLWERIKYRFKK